MINQAQIQAPEEKKKRGAGRVTHAEEQAELLRMREGVKRYVKEELAAGREVTPILTRYLTELEFNMKAQ
jgi:hypothetical protein